MSASTTGLGGINRKLSNLENLKRELVPAGRIIGEIILKQMEIYPPPLPSYRRTYRLKNSFDFDVVERANGVSIINFSYGASSVYGRYDHLVKGTQSQAYMHRGRWNTVKDDLNAVRSDVINEVRKAVKKAVQ